GGDVLVDRRPGLAAVVGAEGAGGRDRRVQPVAIVWIELDRVAAHAAVARLPALAGRVLEEAAHGLPGRAAVVGAEQRPGSAAEPHRVRLGLVARPDVPELLELEPAVLRETDVLRPLPCLAEVVRA